MLDGGGMRHCCPNRVRNEMEADAGLEKSCLCDSSPLSVKRLFHLTDGGHVQWEAAPATAVCVAPRSAVSRT